MTFEVGDPLRDGWSQLFRGVPPYIRLSKDEGGEPRVFIQDAETLIFPSRYSSKTSFPHMT